MEARLDVEGPEDPQLHGTITFWQWLLQELVLTLKQPFCETRVHTDHPTDPFC